MYLVSNLQEIKDNSVECVVFRVKQNSFTTFHNVISWRKSSSGMWHRVAVVWTDISKEHIASIFSLRTAITWLPVISCYSPALKMEAMRFSETSVQTRATRCCISEDDILHSHRRETLKSYMLFHVKKKKSKILTNVRPLKFSFQNTRHHQTAQAIRWSNHVILVFTVGVQSGLCPL
jgi:hypothetical protein